MPRQNHVINSLTEMSHHTITANTSSQPSHATTYQGSGRPPAPYPYYRNTPMVSLPCWRCGAPLSLLQGSIVGVQLYCTGNPCRCAAPDPAVCRCELGPLHQVQNTNSIGTEYGYLPVSHGQNIAVSYPSSVSQPYVNPYGTWTCTASAPVSGLGQTQFQMEQDIRHIGAHFDGVVPPTSPSPDILTGSASGVSDGEPPSSSSPIIIVATMDLVIDIVIIEDIDRVGTMTPATKDVRTIYSL
ncbi:hypothetical protein HD806DRAFT_107132 [Xylariaceae sp. AK1471]|nr:hypothetical protein HD806DRAFT_107132 [Xylariaceae sp. AK1471]